MLRASSRDHILEVAAELVGQEGASQLTIDAVAKRAGISKGGVMYHFGTKDQLLSALVDRLTQAFLAALQAHEAALGDRPEPRLDAMIDQGLRNDPDELKLLSGLLGAVANKPALAEPAARVYAQMYRQFEAMGERNPNALVIALALDGLLFLRLLKLVELDQAQIEQVRGALTHLASHPVPVPEVAGLTKPAPPQRKSRRSST